MRARIGRPDSCFRQRRNIADVSSPLAIVRDFVAHEEEEQFVLDDWPANGAAPLVVAQEWNFAVGTAEIGPGIQYVVLPELISGTMKRVGPAPADLVEHRTAKSVLRPEGRRADLNFLDALEDRIVDVSAAVQHHRCAVRVSLGVVGKVAVYGNSASRVILAACSRR